MSWFTRTPKVEPLHQVWTDTAQRRRTHTPDLLAMAGKHDHLLFVCDEMKQGFPNNHWIEEGSFITNCVTKQDDYVLWLKTYGKSSGYTAIAVETPHPEKPDKSAYNPRSPDPARLRGQLHLIPTETYFELDEVMANGVYFERKRIQVQLPWSRTEMIKVRGMWMPNEFPIYVDAWAYITPSPKVLDDEPWHSLKATSKFHPGPRYNNKRYISNKPYYELTRRDLKDC